jgi:hypothetical protein
MWVLTSILASLGVFNTGRTSYYTTLSYKCLIIEDYEVEYVLNKPSISINSSNLVKIPGVIKIPSPVEVTPPIVTTTTMKTTTITTSVSSPVFTALSSEHQGVQGDPVVEYTETTPLISNVICFESLFFSKYYGIVELYELYLGEFKVYIYVDTFVNGAPYIPGVVDGEAREYYLGVRIGVSNTTRLLELYYNNQLLDMYHAVMEKALGLLIEYRVIYGITDMDIASLKGSLGVGYAWWNKRLVYNDQLMNWHTYKYLVENGFIKGILYEEATTPPVVILTSTTPTTYTTTSQITSSQTRETPTQSTPAHDTSTPQQATTTTTTGMTTSTPGTTPGTTSNQQPASSTETLQPTSPYTQGSTSSQSSAGGITKSTQITGTQIPTLVLRRGGYEEVVVSILVALLVVLISYTLLRSKRVFS